MKFLTQENRIKIAVLLCLSMVCGTLGLLKPTFASYKNETSMTTICEVERTPYYSNILYPENPMVLLPDWTVGSDENPSLNILLGGGQTTATVKLYCETTNSDYVTPYFIWEDQVYSTGQELVLNLEQEGVVLPIHLAPNRSAAEALTKPMTVYVQVKCVITISSTERREVSAELALQLLPQEKNDTTAGSTPENDGSSAEGSSGQVTGGDVSDGDSTSGATGTSGDTTTGNERGEVPSGNAAAVGVSAGDSGTDESEDGDFDTEGSKESDSTTGGSDSGDVSGGDVSSGDAAPSKIKVTIDGNLERGNPLMVDLNYDDKFEKISLKLVKLDSDDNRIEYYFPAFTRYYEKGEDSSFVLSQMACIELTQGKKEYTQLLIDLGQAWIDWADGRWLLEAEAYRENGTVDKSSVELAMKAEKGQTLTAVAGFVEPVVTATENLSWIVNSEFESLYITLERLTANGYVQVATDDSLVLTISEESQENPGHYEVAVSSSNGLARAGTYRLRLRQYYDGMELFSGTVPFFVNYR